MFPLKDNNPTSSFPLVTILLIIANVAVFIYTDFIGIAGDLFYQKFALIPVNVVSFGNATEQGPVQAIGSLLTSQFLHGGLLHIVGNMLFLWIFGNNVEDRFGKILFILLPVLRSNGGLGADTRKSYVAGADAGSLGGGSRSHGGVPHDVPQSRDSDITLDSDIYQAGLAAGISDNCSLGCCAGY